MKFTSTRSHQALSASEVLVRGIASDGGLFVPECFPVLDDAFVQKLIPMSYRDRAAAILPLYLNDFTADEIRNGVDGAYSGTFDNDDPAPLNILIPDYEIADKAESVLKDKDQLILVYCRSGRRSKLAASELVSLGYTNVKEFGGIIDWPYETV